MFPATIFKLALLGKPGVGKDTFIHIFKQFYPDVSVQIVRLAAPLYKAQQTIYNLCSKTIKENEQDGVLLNFLGKHMRTINPHVLVDAFSRTVEDIEKNRSADVILCCDVRPIDAKVVKQLGFTLLHIVADSSLALERRKKRGDLTLGSSSHETEEGLTAFYDRQICNNGTIIEYENVITEYLKEFFHDIIRP